MSQPHSNHELAALLEQEMDPQKLKQFDTLVNAAYLMMRGEAGAARDRCPFPVADIDPVGLKLEAFVIGALVAMCSTCDLPQDNDTLRLIAYLLYLKEPAGDDPLAAAERALIYEDHQEFGPYFDQGSRSALSILRGEANSVGNYAATLEADPAPRVLGERAGENRVNQKRYVQ